MSSGKLFRKRVLITDLRNEFASELANSLVDEEGCLVFTLVPSFPEMSAATTKEGVLPLILNINAVDTKGEEKVLDLLPTLDHVVNVSGDAGLNLVSRVFPSWRIQDFGENKTKPLINKMKETKQHLIFHASLLGEQTLMSKLKGKLDPRFTDSATSQVSTSLRKSFKKFFTGRGGSVAMATSEGEGPSTSAPVTQSRENASEFLSLAASLSGEKKTKTAAVVTETPENRKVKEVLSVLRGKCGKKWEKLLKGMEKEQLSKLKNLERMTADLRKREKKVLLAAANSATSSEQSAAVTEETRRRILASREARVDKEVDKKVEKVRDEETQRIAEEKGKELEKRREKLYQKMLGKEAALLRELREKHKIN